MQAILNELILSNLVNSIRHMLWPMLLKAKGQRSPTTLASLCGVPQGDPQSPDLFHLFMDMYLERVYEIPQNIPASLFVDELFGLVRTLQHLRAFLGDSESLVGDFVMVGRVEVMMPTNYRPSQDQRHKTHKHVPMCYDGWKGKLADSLCHQKEGTSKILFQLCNTTRKWCTKLSHSQNFTKTIFHSVTD